MKSKNELADLVIEGLAGGISPDSHKFHRRVIIGYIDMALSGLVGKIVKSQESQGDFSIDPAWIKAFNKVKIKFDGDRQLCYSDLPATLIALNKSKGLREVRWMDESSSPEPFRLVDPMAPSVLSNLECSELPTGVYHATLEGERVYYPDMPANFAQMNAKVRMKMICGSDGFKNDEKLPIPDDLTDSLIERTMQLLMGFRNSKPKMTNDSRPE